MPRPRVAVKKHIRRRWLPEWTSMGVFSIGIVMRKRTLAVLITPLGGLWHATAIEAPSSADSIGKVFDEHGHKVLGAFIDINKSIAVCEKYAAKWVKGQTKIERCECKEIDKFMKHAKPAMVDAEFEPVIASRSKIAELSKRRARAARKRAA